MLKKNFIFREIGGMWRRVDSQEPKPLILSDLLEQLNIVVDEHAQFVRIVRYKEYYKEIIEYRAYNSAKIIVTQTLYNYE